MHKGTWIERTSQLSSSLTLSIPFTSARDLLLFLLDGDSPFSPSCRELAFRFTGSVIALVSSSGLVSANPLSSSAKSDKPNCWAIRMPSSNNVFCIAGLDLRISPDAYRCCLICWLKSSPSPELFGEEAPLGKSEPEKFKQENEETLYFLTETNSKVGFLAIFVPFLHN